MTISRQLLPERNCVKCSDTQKANWGCAERAAIPVMLDGEDLYRCPLRPFLDDPIWFNEIFGAYRWLQRGMLPDPGTWRDQPAKLVELLQVIEDSLAAVEEHRKEARERAAKQFKAQGRTPR